MAASARVLFDYEAEQEDELTLCEGDIVLNIKPEDEGWWFGELNGKSGMFPENFVEVINGVHSDEKKEVFKVEVKFDYDPEQEDELKLEVGEIVEVTDVMDEGWWKGKCRGKIGVFPANFVVKLENNDKTKSQSMLKKQSASDAGDGLPLPEERTPPKASASKKPNPFGFIKPGDLLRSKLKKVDTQGNDEKTDVSQLSEPIKPTQKVSPLPLHMPNVLPLHPDIQPGNIDTRSGVKKDIIGKNLPNVPDGASYKKAQPFQKAKVIFDYEPEQDDELRLTTGEIVTITDTALFDGWIKGELNGVVGIFPDNFVQVIKEESTDHNLEQLNEKQAKYVAVSDTPLELPISPHQGAPIIPRSSSTIKNTPASIPCQIINGSNIATPVPVLKKPHKGPPPPLPSTKPKPILPSSKLPLKPAPPKHESKAALLSTKPKSTSPIIPKKDLKPPFSILPKTESKATFYTAKNELDPVDVDKHSVKHSDDPEPFGSAVSNVEQKSSSLPYSKNETNISAHLKNGSKRNVVEEVKTEDAAKSASLKSSKDTPLPQGYPPGDSGGEKSPLNKKDPFTESSYKLSFHPSKAIESVSVTVEKEPKNGLSDGVNPDLDSVQPHNILNRIERTKPPSKSPPKKYQDKKQMPMSEVNVMDAKNVNELREEVKTVDVMGDAKKVNELREEVKTLQERMTGMEKKFQKLLMQVSDELDKERRERLNQQIEIDRLKSKLEILTCI